MTEIKTIPDYILPLLIGQQAETLHGVKQIDAYDIDGYRRGVNHPAFPHAPKEYPSAIEFAIAFRPLLRASPADMTEQEVRELIKHIAHSWSWEIKDDEKHIKIKRFTHLGLYVSAYLTELSTLDEYIVGFDISKDFIVFTKVNRINHHDLTAWLASRGFDVFGLIPQGLANAK